MVERNSLLPALWFWLQVFRMFWLLCLIVDVLNAMRLWWYLLMINMWTNKNLCIILTISLLLSMRSCCCQFLWMLSCPLSSIHSGFVTSNVSLWYYRQFPKLSVFCNVTTIASVQIALVLVRRLSRWSWWSQVLIISAFGQHTHEPNKNLCIILSMSLLISTRSCCFLCVLMSLVFSSVWFAFIQLSPCDSRRNSQISNYGGEKQSVSSMWLWLQVFMALWLFFASS